MTAKKIESIHVDNVFGWYVPKAIPSRDGAQRSLRVLTKDFWLCRVDGYDKSGCLSIGRTTRTTVGSLVKDYVRIGQPEWLKPAKRKRKPTHAEIFRRVKRSLADLQRTLDAAFAPRTA